MSITPHPTIQINGVDTPFQVHKLPPARVAHSPAAYAMQFATQDSCIYCGRTDNLTDEHIIPYGLSGEHVLPKASCVDCAKITGRMEQQLLRGPMRAARILRKLNSRTRHQNFPQTHRLTYIKDGFERKIDLPLEEYPILLHFPIFQQPGYLTGKSTTGIDLKGMHTVYFGRSPQDVAVSLGATALKFPASREEPYAFARLIAKIGFGFAVASGEIRKLQTPSALPEYILGKASDIGRWVFTDDSETVTYPDALHRIQMHEMHGLLVAEVQLFSDSQAPRYGAILGVLRENTT